MTGKVARRPFNIKRRYPVAVAVIQLPLLRGTAGRGGGDGHAYRGEPQGGRHGGASAGLAVGGVPLLLGPTAAGSVSWEGTAGRGGRGTATVAGRSVRPLYSRPLRAAPI